MAQTLNYQPLSQIMGILSFVSTSLLHSLNAALGQAGTPGQANNATYVLMQGYGHGLASSWTSLYGPNVTVQTVYPKRPVQPPSGAQVYTVSVNGTTFLCQIDSSGLMSAVPALNQSWATLWNQQTWPFLQSIQCDTMDLAWSNPGVGLNTSEASFTLTMTSAQGAQTTLVVTIQWNTLGASVGSLGATVTGGQDVPLNWSVVFNGATIVLSNTTVASLMQALVKYDALVYNQQLSLSFG